MRTLHLTNPLMHGSDVKAAQGLLHKHGWLAEADVDGFFGSKSAYASEVAKFRLGYPSADIKPMYGAALNAYLKGKAVPPDYKVRAHARLGESYHEFEILALRHKVVTMAQWGIHNEHGIHYEQRRPIDGYNHPFQLPLFTDCSGFVTLCYTWAGCPDPNGRNDALGFTGTLLHHMKPITKAQVRLADLVVYGSFPGHHTALVIAGGDDPLLASHGSEKGPLAIRHSEESKFQPKVVTWLRIPEWV